MRGDMIEAFKILTRLYDGRVTEGMLDISRSHITRGNALIPYYLMLPYVDSACSSCLGSIGSSSSSFLTAPSLPVVGPYSAQCEIRLYDGRVTEGMLDISRSHITRGNALKLVKHRNRRDIRK
jgi:hypothetical protein